MFKGYIYRHWIVNEKGVEKSYIGQTSMEIDKRWENGRGYLKNSQDSKFARAIKKYGWENFHHEIIEVVYMPTKQLLLEELDKKEVFNISKYNSFYNGYNSTTGGLNGLHNEETKKRISESLKGKYVGEKHHNYGKSVDEKTRQKISDSLKGEKSYYYGKTLSEEHRQKISESHMGAKNPMYGKNFSEEHKQKIGDAIRGDKNGKARKVICLNTLQVFNTINDANEYCGLKGKGITKCCTGQNKTAGLHPETNERLKWMYYDEYLKTIK